MESREEMLRGKAAPLVKLYDVLEKRMAKWSAMEIVYKRRYALLRTTRVFADLVFMRDALRIAVLLDHECKDELFFKRERMSARRVAHVAKARMMAELKRVMPYIEEAYHFATGDVVA